MPGQHTDKEKRMAAHVKESEARRGKSDEEAERIAWATVNARQKKETAWSRFRKK